MTHFDDIFLPSSRCSDLHPNEWEFDSTAPQQPSNGQPSNKQCFQKTTLNENMQLVFSIDVGTTNMWKWFNILITAPALIACAFYTVPAEIKHLAHLKEHPTQWEGFSYMRKRNKPFAWGDNSLFHSDHTNPGPPE